MIRKKVLENRVFPDFLYSLYGFHSLFVLPLINDQTAIFHVHYLADNKKPGAVLSLTLYGNSMPGYRYVRAINFPDSSIEEFFLNTSRYKKTPLSRGVRFNQYQVLDCHMLLSIALTIFAASLIHMTKSSGLNDWDRRKMPLPGGRAPQ